MGVTTLEGVVENGQIRLPATIRLPEKAKVYVIIPDMEVKSIPNLSSPRLVHPEQAADFEKQVVEDNGDANL